MKLKMKIRLAIMLMLILQTITFVQEALSNEHSCRYEKKKFLTEQMLKHKQNRINTERTPILIGVDALFL